MPRILCSENLDIFPYDFELNISTLSARCPIRRKKLTGNHAFTLCGNLREGTMREVNGIAISASRAGISNGNGNRLGEEHYDQIRTLKEF